MLRQTIPTFGAGPEVVTYLLDLLHQVGGLYAPQPQLNPARFEALLRTWSRAEKWNDIQAGLTGPEETMPLRVIRRVSHFLVQHAMQTPLYHQLPTHQVTLNSRVSYGERVFEIEKLIRSFVSRSPTFPLDNLARSYGVSSKESVDKFMDHIGERHAVVEKKNLDNENRFRLMDQYYQTLDFFLTKYGVTDTENFHLDRFLIMILDPKHQIYTDNIDWGHLKPILSANTLDASLEWNGDRDKVTAPGGLMQLIQEYAELSGESLDVNLDIVQDRSFINAIKSYNPSQLISLIYAYFEGLIPLDMASDNTTATLLRHIYCLNSEQRQTYHLDATSTEINGQSIVRWVLLAFLKGLYQLKSQIHIHRKRQNYPRMPEKDLLNGPLHRSSGLDIWQANIVSNIEKGFSVITSGATSGGKTYVSMIVMDTILRQEKHRGLGVYPTASLALQVYADVRKTCPDKADQLAVVTDNYTHIPQNAAFVIGTPDQLLKCFSGYQGDEYEVALTNKVYAKFDFIIVDEVHAGFLEYDQGAQTRYMSSCMVETFNMLKEGGQMLCLSASLAAFKHEVNDSMGIQVLKQRMNQAGVKQEIKVVAYDRSDIGVKREGDIGVMPPPIYYDYLESGLVDHRQGQDHSPVDLSDPSQLLKMMLCVWEQNISPCAIFFDDSVDLLNKFCHLMKYISDLELKSYSEVLNVVGKTDTQLSFQNVLKMKFQHPSGCLTRLLSSSVRENLLKLKKIQPDVKNKLQNIDLNTPKSPRDYVILNLLSKLDVNDYTDIYVSYSDLFYSFSRSLYTTDITDNDFKSMLVAEGYNENDENSRKVYGYMTEAVKRGISCLSSDIPLALQYTTLANLQRGKSGVGFVLSSKEMSMGMNLSFVSVVIIGSLTHVVDMLTGQFLQLQGRAGRRVDSMRAEDQITPRVITVNTRYNITAPIRLVNFISEPEYTFLSQTSNETIINSLYELGRFLHRGNISVITDNSFRIKDIRHSQGIQVQASLLHGANLIRVLKKAYHQWFRNQFMVSVSDL